VKIQGTNGKKTTKLFYPFSTTGLLRPKYRISDSFFGKHKKKPEKDFSIF
jgi:hypothetical protein